MLNRYIFYLGGNLYPTFRYAKKGIFPPEGDQMLYFSSLNVGYKKLRTPSGAKPWQPISSEKS